MRGEYGRTHLTRTARLVGARAGHPRRARRLDEPLRRDHRGPARLPGDGIDQRCASRRARGRRASHLGRAVPSRGRPHAVRHDGAADVPPRSRRLRTDVAHELGRRRAGRPHPGPDRRRTCDLCAVGRRRLVGRGGARPSRHRSPADLRLRRHRADAQGRERADRRDLPAHDGSRADPRRRRATATSKRSRASPIRR